MKRFLVCLMLLALMLPTAALAGNDPIVTPAGTFPIVTEPITITLAVPTAQQVEDLNTNYYTKWLEEKSGINLEFMMLPTSPSDIASKIQVMLAGGVGLPDAFIGTGRTTTLFNATYAQRYGDEGQIIPLNGLIEEYGAEVKKLYEEYGFRDLCTSANGNVYFMPGYSDSPINFYYNKMWINKGWLEKLGLTAPTTTDEFYEMLKAFKERDPNGNGKQDEIPLAGTEATATASVYDYLINAFIYNDTRNSRIGVQDGALYFAPTDARWREAMRYLRKLCAEGLLSELSFTQDAQQLQQMANDTNDILGAFPALGVQLGAQANDSAAKARWTGLAPLLGPEGVRYSTASAAVPYANGVITSTCEHPEALFRLFDLMLSEEACLIGRYGIKGQDWDEPAQGDISIYGTQAAVKILKQIWGPVQNTHWLQQCPYISRPKYSCNVGWNGDPYDVEYMNAQASLLYEDTEPAEYVKTFIYSEDEVEEAGEMKVNIDQYVKQSIAYFVTGNWDIDDDAAWQRYVDEFAKMGLDRYMEINQTVYDRMTK